MAIRIKLPNGQYGNFPDDMPHDQIEAVLQKQFPVQPQEPEQSFLNKLPRNIGAGALQGLTGLINIPYNIAQMLPSQKRSDSYETALGESLRATNAERIPHIPQYDYTKMLGIKGQPTTSDEAIQLATELALPVGGAGKLAAKGFKALAEHLPAVTSKGLSKEILAGKNIAEQKYKGLYNNLFEEAKKHGITSVQVPSIQSNIIEKNSMPKYHTALKEFLSKPTIENAHKAQSDLGKLQRAMEKADSINPLTSTQQKTYRAVTDAKDKIKKSMFSMSSQKHPESIFDKYESGDLFGVTANPNNTFLPNNSVGMAKKGNKAIVIDSKVENTGQGLGKDLYRQAINLSKEKGLQFESDEIVSESALNVYKSLEKEGYKFKYNPDVEKITREDGQIAYKSKKDNEPVAKLISAPSNKSSQGKLLNEKYNKITSGYKKDVIPYKSNKSLNQFIKGELGHQKLIQRLKNNDAFMLSLGKQYPGLKINDLLKSNKSKYILSSILGAAGIKGIDSLIH